MMVNDESLDDKSLLASISRDDAVSAKSLENDTDIDIDASFFACSATRTSVSRAVAIHLIRNEKIASQILNDIIIEGKSFSFSLINLRYTRTVTNSEAAAFSCIYSLGGMPCICFIAQLIFNTRYRRRIL